MNVCVCARSLLCIVENIPRILFHRNPFSSWTRRKFPPRRKPLFLRFVTSVRGYCFSDARVFLHFRPIRKRRKPTELARLATSTKGGVMKRSRRRLPLIKHIETFSFCSDLTFPPPSSPLAHSRNPRIFT